MEFVEGNAGKKMQKALQNYSHNLWLLREYRELYNDTLLEKQRMLQHVSQLLTISKVAFLKIINQYTKQVTLMIAHPI